MILSPSTLRSVSEIGRWAAGRRARYRVTGPSMEPTLFEGEFVLVDPSAVPEVGDVVVADHPEQADLIVVKRVAERTADGTIVLVGDDPRSTDSTSWGPVAADAVRGCVTLVLDRPSAVLDRPVADTDPDGDPVGDRHRSVPGGLARWLRR